MSIDWNKVDKAKLEYIQQKEAAKAKYKKDYLIYLDKKHNQNFLDRLFNPVEEPEELIDSDFVYYYPYKENHFFYMRNDRINIYIPSSIPKKVTSNIICYLNSNIIDDCIKGGNIISKYNGCCINDNEENRQKVNKVIALFEKHFYDMNKSYYKKQQEAEAYIDNYINNKEGK